MSTRRSMLKLLVASFQGAPLLARSFQGAPALERRIDEVTRRPEFAGARWGMRFRRLNTGESLYATNAGQPFVAASSAKLFTAGTVFATLGPRHRFRTRVHRTGPLARGTVRGDVVLVAAGDLVLSSRIRPDGTVAYPHPDHTYDSTPGVGPVPGDPLRVVRSLARQVARQGVERITGQVRIDTTLFREGRAVIGIPGAPPIAVSPMMLNDNVVDVTVLSGPAVDAPAVLRVSPQTAYVRIVNGVTTIAADGSAPERLAFTGTGGNEVTITGEIPYGSRLFRVYHVPEPARFAQVAFTQALQECGVAIGGNALPPTDAQCATLAEHVSPPLAEQVKVMLKVSSNVHASYYPYLVGAIAGGESDDPKRVYEAYRRALFERAGLVPPATDDGLYTPDFFTGFLAHLAGQRSFGAFREALPILGRDGSLVDVQPGSPAAGHVFAKSGTGKGDGVVNGALAGYIHLRDGDLVAFAELVQLHSTAPDAHELVHHALGEIAATVYNAVR